LSVRHDQGGKEKRHHVSGRKLQRLLSNLQPKQKIVLQAIAKEGLAKNITSTKFIKKYNLNSASSVQSAIRLLLKNDLVTQSDGVYRVYDYFFAEWLSTIY
jgi:hypothetical protein